MYIQVKLDDNLKIFELRYWNEWENLLLISFIVLISQSVS